MKYIFLFLINATVVLAQLPQTITTYSSSSFPITTTISPNGNGGYNYSRIGNGGSVWGGVTAAPGTTVSAVVGSHGDIVPIVTPNAPEPVPNYPIPMPMPMGDSEYYPQRQSAPHPNPTPEIWVDPYTGKPAPAPAGLKHTSLGEPLLNPYTHGVTATDHPPVNSGPWQQYLIACKVPSNKLMRERTMFAYLDGFNALEIYKIRIGTDPTSEKKYHQQFAELIAPLSADQKAQFRLHLCEDFGVKDPKQIEIKEMIPYLKQWIRTDSLKQK